MKRTLTLLTMLTGFAITGMAQGNSSTNPNSSNCTASPQMIIDELCDCLTSKGVMHQLAPSMNSNELYLIAEPDTPLGLVQSCLVQYNHDAENCPTAPVLIRANFYDF